MQHKTFKLMPKFPLLKSNGIFINFREKLVGHLTNLQTLFSLKLKRNSNLKIS